MKHKLQDNIFLNQKITNKNSIMKIIGSLMLEKKVATKKYVESFIKRDEQSSVALGNKLALVHGTYETSRDLKENYLCFFHLEKPIPWGDEMVSYVIGLAASNNSQMDFIEKIALAFSDDEALMNFEKTPITKERVLQFLNIE